MQFILLEKEKDYIVKLLLERTFNNEHVTLFVVFSSNFKVYKTLTKYKNNTSNHFKFSH